MIDFVNYALNGALVGCLYALVALGFVVIHRASKVFNFAQGEILALSGFMVWTFATGLGWPLPAALACSIVTATLLGLAIERMLFRRLAGAPVFAMVMVTLGLLVLLRGAMLVVWGAAEKPFPALIPMQPVIVADLILPRALLFGAAITVLITSGLWWTFNNTRIGLRLTAVSEDHQIALSLGVSVQKATAAAWVLGSVISVIGAVIYLNGRSISPMSSEIGLAALPVAMLAGLESIGGLVVAGILIGVVQSLTAAYVDTRIGGSASVIVPYLFMLGVLLVRPAGFFGWKTLERV
ncbi:MAG: branched-chain amino acid ABC transporter permease [Burkholderiales bacterium]|nr:branched-chain amino acid ABC transporter permease [Burkholderiales bacterium]OJX05966.1 MAG: branched-chain amino acid ABC transporter permease [Burkholderiales bacterium 70-64]